MNEVLNIILEDTFTLAQFQTRVRILKSYLLKTFFGNAEKIQSSDQPDLDWLKGLPKTIYQYFNKDNVYDIFLFLESSTKKLQVLTIYLAFEANDQSAGEIGTFARRTFGNSSLLLDIKFDPRLIAGCTLVWKGIFQDYSIISKIEGRKTEILDSFKKFLR